MRRASGFGLSPPPSAPHARPALAGGGAGAGGAGGAVGHGFLVGAGAHLVEGGLARRAAARRADTPLPTRLRRVALPLKGGGKRAGRQIGVPAVFSAPRAGAGAVLARLLAREWIVGHRKLGRLQPLDLVAQPRRLLEIEIGRRRAAA